MVINATEIAAHLYQIVKMELLCHKENYRLTLKLILFLSSIELSSLFP